LAKAANPRRTQSRVKAAIKFARADKYPLAEMICHRFSLEQAHEAIQLVGGEVEREMPLKVVLDPTM